MSWSFERRLDFVSWTSSVGVEWCASRCRQSACAWVHWQCTECSPWRWWPPLLPSRSPRCWRPEMVRILLHPLPSPLFLKNRFAKPVCVVCCLTLFSLLSVCFTVLCCFSIPVEFPVTVHPSIDGNGGTRRDLSIAKDGDNICRSEACLTRGTYGGGEGKLHFLDAFATGKWKRIKIISTRQSPWVETGAFPWRVGGGQFCLRSSIWCAFCPCGLPLFQLRCCFSLGTCRSNKINTAVESIWFPLWKVVYKANYASYATICLRARNFRITKFWILAQSPSFYSPGDMKKVQNEKQIWICRKNKWLNSARWLNSRS